MIEFWAKPNSAPQGKGSDGAKNYQTTHYQDVHARGTADQDKTTHYYNGNGHLTSAYIADGQSRTVNYTNDLNGQVLRREVDISGSAPAENWYRFGGREMGYVGNNGTLNVDAAAATYKRTQTGTGIFSGGASSGTPTADFDGNYQALNSYNQGSNAGGYTVRSGDTLQGIAAGLYGDSSLWYKIAQANGLSGSTTLIEGTTLRLPAGVTRNTYNASVFKPYDPGTAIGDTAPTAPEPPKNGENNKCGIIGAILTVIVAVAVFAITKDFVTTAKIFASLGKTGAAVATAATAGAVSSAASQGFAIAAGIQEKFSFKGVALAAISAGVTGGLDFDKATSFLQGARQALTSNVISQGIGLATGLQKRFSWAGLAAAGVGGGVGAELSDNFGSGIGGDIARSGAVAIANAATRSAIDGSNFGDNIIAAIPDVIGQAVGGKLGGSISSALGLDANPTSRVVSTERNEATQVAGSAVAYGGGSSSPVDEIIVTGTRRSFDISGLNARISRSIEASTLARSRADFDANILPIISRRSSVIISDITKPISAFPPDRTPYEAAIEDGINLKFAGFLMGTKKFINQTTDGLDYIVNNWEDVNAAITHYHGQLESGERSLVDDLVTAVFQAGASVENALLEYDRLAAIDQGQADYFAGQKVGESGLAIGAFGKALQSGKYLSNDGFIDAAKRFQLDESGGVLLPVSVSQRFRNLTGIAKDAKWVQARQGIDGPGLRDHFDIHGVDVGAKNPRLYDLSARETIQNGRSFTYRDRSTNDPRVGYFDQNKSLFVATSQVRSQAAILTHYPATWESLRKLPGFTSSK